MRGARGAGGAGGGGDAHDRPIRHSWLFALRPASRVYASRSRKRPRRSRVNAGRVYPLYGYVIINIHRHRSESRNAQSESRSRIVGGGVVRMWPGGARSAGSSWRLESSPRQKKPECRKRSACTKPVACTRIRKWRVRVRRTPQLLSRGGGTTTPLGASCAHSSALLSPSTACERRARPRTHGELRTSRRCGEHLHALRLRKSRSAGRVGFRDQLL